MRKILSKEFLKHYKNLDKKTKLKVKKSIDMFPDCDIKKIKGQDQSV